jgi:death-on-curing family protein
LPKRSNPPCKLGTAYVEWIHDHLIGTLWPEIDPVSKNEYRSVELLESALARPFHSAGGQDAYPSVIDQATALLHSLIANHPFQNGNKRTAVLAVDAFLLGNGYTLALDNDKMYELAQKTASYKQRGLTHEESFQEIKDTLTKFAVPLSIFYREQRKHTNLSKFYTAMIAIRRSVRSNPYNELIRAT